MYISHQDEILYHARFSCKSCSLMLELMHLANLVSSAIKNGSADRILLRRIKIKNNSGFLKIKIDNIG